MLRSCGRPDSTREPPQPLCTTHDKSAVRSCRLRRDEYTFVVCRKSSIFPRTSIAPGTSPRRAHLPSSARVECGVGRVSWGLSPSLFSLSPLMLLLLLLLLPPMLHMIHTPQRPDLLLLLTDRCLGCNGCLRSVLNRTHTASPHSALRASRRRGNRAACRFCRGLGSQVARVRIRRARDTCTRREPGRGV